MNILTKNFSNELKIKKSIFICNLFPVSSQEEIKTNINNISKFHKNANHNCWAYILGEKGETFHFSDNGEPSGSAGRPILNALNSYELTNVLAIVTRYFGGIKLGIRGLIDAYSTSTKETLELSKITKLIKYTNLIIYVDYKYSDSFRYKIKKFNIIINNIDYNTLVEFNLSINEENIKSFLIFCENLINIWKIKIKRLT